MTGVVVGLLGKNYLNARFIKRISNIRLGGLHGIVAKGKGALGEIEAKGIRVNPIAMSDDLNDLRLEGFVEIR